MKPFEDEESYLRFRLDEIRKNYMLAAEPYLTRLVEIMAMKPLDPAFLTITLNEVEPDVSLAEKGSEKLKARFSKMSSEGLVDVKFDIAKDPLPTGDEAIAEFNALYDAVDEGKSTPLDFNDSHR